MVMVAVEEVEPVGMEVDAAAAQMEKVRLEAVC